MSNTSQESHVFLDAKPFPSPICVLERWAGGYWDVYGGGEVGCSYDEVNCKYEKQGSCRSPQIDIVDLLPSDPFKFDILPLDPFGMDGDYSSWMASTAGEIEAGGGGDGLLNLLCRGRKPNGFPVNKVMVANNLDGGPNSGGMADSDAISWIDDSLGWGEAIGSGENMGSFEKHICYGSALSNIVDLLPSDPFGMENGTLVCRGRVRFMPEVGNMEVEGNSNSFAFDGVILASDLEDLLNIGQEFDSDLTSFPVDELQVCGESSSSHHDSGGDPHYALFLALHYMGVKELVTMERVCKSLNEAVKNNPSLWKTIHVDCPLNGMLTDDALVILTQRASGHLKSLTLVGCFKITDAGIRHVINNNPELAKLSVPGCFKLSIEGILTTFTSAKVLAIKKLRVGGLAGISNEQYVELKNLLGTDHQSEKSKAHKALYYHNRRSYLSVDDDRAIDIEQCPRCNKVRLVYDCPAERCQKESSPPCKACILCITRCISCGSCLTERDYVETFVLEAICLECWNDIFGSPDKGKFNQPILCQATSYFCFYG